MVNNMQPNVQISGLGPHRKTVLDLRGPGTLHITGASGSGKSQIVEAYAFALLNRPVMDTSFLVTAERAEVKLEIDGKRLAVSLTSGGSWSRRIASDPPAFAPTRDAWLDLLGLGGIDDLAAFVLTPMATADLLGTDCGRPLRDLLVKAACIGANLSIRDVVGSLVAKAGFAYTDADPDDEDGAKNRLTLANRAADHASGALASATEARKRWAAPEAPPTDADETAARDVLFARDAWGAYDRAMASDADARARRAALEATLAEVLPSVPDTTSAAAILDVVKAWEAHATALERWESQSSSVRLLSNAKARRDATLSALGQRPALPEIPAGTRERLAKGETITAEMRTKAARLKAEADHAASHYTQVKNGGSTCPTCGQRNTAEKTATIEADAKAAKDGAAKTAAAEADLLRRSEEKLTEVRKIVADFDAAAAARAAYDRAVTQAGSEIVVPELPARPTPPPENVTDDQVRQARADIEAAVATRASATDLYRRQVAAREALATMKPTTDVTMPAAPRPTPEAVASAGLTLTTRDTLTAVHARATADRERLDAAVKAATEANDKASAEAARATAILDAVRRAPGVQLERVRERIGDLGPVSLRVPPKENKRTPEIEVIVDTVVDGSFVVPCPFRSASTGWKLIADLYLRAAVRRLAGLDWIPLFVDSAGNWTEDWPDLDGLVLLWSQEGPLRATPAASEAA